MTIKLSRKTLGWSLGIVAAGLATGVMAAPHIILPRIISDALPSIEARDVEQALKARLPKTRIDKIICGSIGALCEINAGGTLFYVDKTARYLLVGRIYDMETRQDLTAARLLELNPDLIAAGGAKATAHDPLIRMAMVPRVLEARGLDVSPKLIEKLKMMHENDLVEALNIILLEEEGHVVIGNRWFQYLCQQRQMNPEETFFSLLASYGYAPLSGPFNLTARARSGFSKTELEKLVNNTVYPEQTSMV